MIGLPFFPSLAFRNLAPELLDPLVTLYMQEAAKRGLFGGPGHFFCLQHTQSDLAAVVEIIGAALATIRKALDEGDISKYLECPVRQSGFRRLV